MDDAVWIVWERQRRSIELAKQFNCRLYVFDYDGLLRYPKSIAGTVMLLLKKSSRVIFVQNPSMILATVACLMKMILKNRIVIVDRHTTFRLDYKKKGFENRLFMFLHKFTIRVSDLTIVTNDFLAGLVEDIGGAAHVLEDKLPDFPEKNIMDLKGRFNIFLISSFAPDEPILEVIKAVEVLDNPEVCLYVSGNYKKLECDILSSAPSNIFFTGFLSEQDFVDTLHSSDIVMVLTTSDCCMLCGCYEAVAAEKPLITSNKKVLFDYFKGSIFVDNTEAGIADGIRSAIDLVANNINTSAKLKIELDEDWRGKFSDLKTRIEQFR